MRRREFITLLGGAAAWPLAARAQQPAMPVIGFLSSGSPDAYADLWPRSAGLERNRLCRGPERGDRIPLGGGPVRSIAGAGGRSGSPSGDCDRRDRYPCGAGGKGGDHDDSDCLRQAADPVAAGTCRQPEPTGRQPHGRDRHWRGASAEAAGAAARAGARGDHRRSARQSEPIPSAENQSRTLQAAARTLGLQLHVLHASTERDFDAVFATLVQLRAGALVIGADPFFNSRSEQLAALALRHAVPTIYQYREFAAAGGLMSYGGSLTDYVPSGRRLHRPDSQGREARRPAGPAVHESRADHQPQDRQGARPHRSALAARPRRRGDRVATILSMQMLHLLRSPHGTQETPRIPSQRVRLLGCCGHRGRRHKRGRKARSEVDIADIALVVGTAHNNHREGIMVRITRRRLLKLSGAAAAGPTGGLAAILTTGQAPAYAQGTSLHWLRLGRLRARLRRAAAARTAAGSGKGARAENHLRDHQRQRPAGAHHLGDPVGHRRGHHTRPAQLAASLCRKRRRRERCRRGDRRPAGRLLRHFPGGGERRETLARRAVGRDRHPDLLPQVLVRRNRLHHVPRHLGRSTARPAKRSRPRAGRSGRPSVTPTATRWCFPIRTCGRGAARKSRRTARPSRSTARRPWSRSSS